MMSCDQLINQFLMDYVDGALGPDAMKDFEAHLGVCPSCRNYVDAYRATMRLTRAGSLPPTASDLPKPPESLVQAILKSRKPH